MVISCRSNSLEPAKYADRTIKIEQVTKCPICKVSLKPLQLHSVYKICNHKIYLDNFLFCTNCNHSFISSYESYIDSEHSLPDALSIASIEPQKFEQYKFDESINALSPQFVKIYNQALAAEISDLDEIAGLGYRKALEFLVKDFAIHQHPESEDEIKKLMLSACISKYIDNPQIKILVERSAWIGNDEAHYIRKQETRDVEDMKSFIKATVYFISMVLITEDAASMTPVK